MVSQPTVSSCWLSSLKNYSFKKTSRRGCSIVKLTGIQHQLMVQTIFHCIWLWFLVFFSPGGFKLYINNKVSFVLHVLKDSFQFAVRPAEVLGVRQVPLLGPPGTPQAPKWVRGVKRCLNEASGSHSFKSRLTWPCRKTALTFCHVDQVEYTATSGHNSDLTRG